MREIRRGEIYFVDLNPIKGREQAGNRPVLVLSIDAINKQPLGSNGGRWNQRGESSQRLSYQCSRLASGERIADGNGVSLFPDPFFISPSISSVAQWQGRRTNFIKN
jgi:hypothetical protein